MSTTTNANAVRTLYPKAICIEQEMPGGPGYIVKPLRSSVTVLGSGHTPGEAWADALQHPSFKDRVEPMTDAEIVPDIQSLIDNAPDMVNHPPHYTASESGIECIEAIKAALTPEEFRGFCKGNALKYSWRERHKGGDEDLKKAAWYLNKITES